MSILITGGAGYIGSHTCTLLLDAGIDIVVVDNFCNSHPESMARVKKLTARDFPVHELDINDKTALDAVFKQHTIDSVIHFAGLKAVGESNEIPLAYYRCNLGGSLSLCEVMEQNNCRKLVFSSSATVYGDPKIVPITEDSPTYATNPYGRSKLMVEQVLTDVQKARPNFWSITLLRYFNPIGAHKSGEIGEDPSSIPNNLLPYIAQVASGKLERVNVFGDDYNTKDGTGVRDYIHVLDLAQGHLNALQHLEKTKANLNIFNLGTGIGYSVLEMIEKFREISQQNIPHIVTPRRPGDIATCYADPQKALDILEWSCKYNLEDMIQDTWNWQKNNPTGYASY